MREVIDMAMTHRERVLTALSHCEPDRIPFDFGGTICSSIHIAPYQKLKAYFGVEAEDTIINRMMQTVAVHEPIMQALDVDFRLAVPGGPDNKPILPVGEDGYQDEYGVVRRKPASSYYYDLVKCPLAGPISLQDILNFPWPDPADPGYTRGLRERLLYYRENTDYATVMRLPVPFVHTTQFLRGFEDWFTDLAADKKLAAALFDAALEHNTAVAEVILKAAGDLVDVVAVSEDLGFQNSLIVSPELYRELFKPRHQKYFATVKQHTSAFVHLHSCGSVYKLIPDFIEFGADVLNPVQVAARDMDSSILGPEFGQQLGFCGAIDTQKVLPHGTPEDVKVEVRRRIRDLAPGGGYVLAPVHNIQPGVPVANIIAMYQAGKEHGQYPITLD
jgi:uroporphyrinogen decarboxylase